MRTLKATMLAPMIALAAVAGANAADDWQRLIICSVDSPAAGQKLNLYYSYNTANEAVSAMIRIGTDTEILGAKDAHVQATFEVEGQGSFTFEARGAGNEKQPLVILTVPADSKVFTAISRGHKAVATIPAPSGEQKLEFDLAGSGAAVKHISRCRP